MDKRADVEAKTKGGQAALQRAAGSGEEEVVRLMLEHIGGESSSEKWLRTAQIHNAVSSGDEATVRLLLEKSRLHREGQSWRNGAALGGGEWAQGSGIVAIGEGGGRRGEG
jgi:Ankyrin repeats (3 copies)